MERARGRGGEPTDGHGPDMVAPMAAAGVPLAGPRVAAGRPEVLDLRVANVDLFELRQRCKRTEIVELASRHLITSSVHVQVELLQRRERTGAA